MQLEPIRLKQPRGDWSRSAVLGDRSSNARDFADQVAGQLVGTVLPWSQRETLIQSALGRGITRFEANLIIAAVQHQMGVGHRRNKPERAARRPRRQIAAGVGLFLLVQAGIVAAAWHWLF